MTNIIKQGHAVSSGNNPRMAKQTPIGGLLIRGVVIATYSGDEPTMLGINDLEPLEARRPFIYCDVLTYASSFSMHSRIVRRCLVLGNNAGIYDGRTWTPRPASRNGSTNKTLTGSSVTYANPADLDGDHVLICFLDGRMDMPAILCGVPHPGGKTIPEKSTAGSVMYEHHGVVFSIDTLGNLIVDLARANDGIYDKNNEEDSAVRGDTLFSPYGNIDIRPKARANFSITTPSYALSMHGNGSLDLSASSELGFSSLNFGRTGRIALAHLLANSGYIIDASGNVIVQAGEDTTNKVYTKDHRTYARNVAVRADGDRNVEVGGDEYIRVVGDHESRYDKNVSIFASESWSVDAPSVSLSGDTADLNFTSVDIGSSPNQAVVGGDLLLNGIVQANQKLSAVISSAISTMSATPTGSTTHTEIIPILTALSVYITELSLAVEAAMSQSVKVSM